MSFIILLAVLVGAIYFIFNNMKPTKYTLQKIVLALSIIIVLNLFFNYGIYTFYPSPKYNDFCTEENRKYYDNQEDCEAVGGEWGAYSGRAQYPKSVLPPIGEFEEPTEYCDAQATCKKQYDEVYSLYNRNVFIALVLLGTTSITLGFFLVAVSAISAGFLFGGLFSLFIGTTRYWSDMNDYLHLIILGIVLMVLIWLGYRKLKDKEENEK